MRSGDWLKNIIGLKKAKNGKPKSLKGSSALQNSNGLKKDLHFQKEFTNPANGTSNGNPGDLGMPVEDIAAIQIQSAFRAYKNLMKLYETQVVLLSSIPSVMCFFMRIIWIFRVMIARKIRRHLKGTVRLRTVTLGCSTRKQASTTLTYLHTWSRIQAEIRARRTGMAVEARIKQRKLENQLKLEAKLHGLEVEWSNGPETMEAVLARIHLREEAAVKRERAMAYAFSHQWRANSKDPVLGNYELGKAIWGWSWMERWIAARPWESRAVVQSTPKKAMSRQSSKTGKNLKSPTIKSLNSVKSISPNGKETTKARKLSYGAADQEANAKKEMIVS